MRTFVIAAATAALTCLFAIPGQAQTAPAQTSQQALMKTCNTNATVQKLRGDARKSFMSDCLAGHASAQAPQPTAPSPQAAQQQRMRDCNANAASQNLRGQGRRDFMSSCLSGGGTAAAPASTSATAPAPSPATTSRARAAAPETPSAATQMAPAPAPTASVPQQQPSRAARTAPASTTGSAAGTAGAQPGEFSTEAIARSSCGTDTVVWVNTESHIYHFKNNANYGRTKQGAYMCEREAISAGSHAAKNEKRS